MDSPVFGNNPAPAFKRSNHSESSKNSVPTQLVAVLTLQKNLLKVRHIFRRIQLRHKRQCFLEINKPEKVIRECKNKLSTKQLINLLKVERNLGNMYGVINRQIIKQKINVISRIKQISCGLDQISRKSERIVQQSRNTSEWKQNSNYNILDISLQNRKLRDQIKKDTCQQQKFVQMMSDLLDKHQHPKSNISRKK